MEEENILLRNRERTFQRAFAAFKVSEEISDRNKTIVLRYLRDAKLGKTIIGRARKKIGPARLHSYIVHLSVLIGYLDNDLDRVTQADMEAFVEALEGGKILSRRRRLQGRTCQVAADALSERYIVDIKVSVKKFYKWLWGRCRTYPEIVEWIDTYCETNEVPALTPAEVERLLDGARKPVQRALIQVLFDGGLRIGELLNVRLRHVQLRAYDPQRPEQRCFFVRVPHSKTLRRTVALPMAASTKWLGLWLEDHPRRPAVTPEGIIECDDVSTPLFPLSEDGVRAILRNLGKDALNKRVYPHLMRHTSATYWSNRLPYFKFCKRFGWTMTSKMPQRYIDREGVDELDVARLYAQQEGPDGAVSDVVSPTATGSMGVLANSVRNTHGARRRCACSPV